MQSRTIMRIVAAALAVGLLSACDRASRDVGADMAACDLEEMKAQYEFKTRLYRERSYATDQETRSGVISVIELERARYLKLCMRTRGWQQRSSDRCGTEEADKPKCYEPATPAGDDILK